MLHSRYAGPMDEAHWQAVVRVAVGAHTNMASLASPGIDRLTAAGTELITGFTWSRETLLSEVGSSRAWRRLPLTLALGADHLRAAQSELGTTDERAVRFGAALHACAAVIDYIVDESPSAEDLRRALSPELVDSFFESELAWQAHLAQARSSSRMPLTALVLDLLEGCGGSAWALRDEHPEAARWAPLHRLVTDLTRSELANDPCPADLSLMDRSRVTSVGLSQALGEIALLSKSTPKRTAASTPEIGGFRARMELLGQICWVVDDLVDLLEDERRGHLNALLLGEPAARLTDGDLYRLAQDGATRLTGLLTALGDGPLHHLGLQLVALWTGASNAAPASVSAPPPHRSSTSREVDPIRAAGERATALVVEAAEEGVERHAHALRLPRLADLGRETHRASLLVRGVIVDALLDAREAGMSVPAPLINREVMAMLREKHPLVRGGWNYVSTVPELPPDIDDLGQVLQVLARHGGEDLARTALEGARMAVDGQDHTGGIGTWVLDHRGTSPADADVLAYLPVMGGWGTHPEVVANFASGLLEVDPTRWAQPLWGICRYLEAAQEADGSWTSRWYADPYYGTFRAASVLSSMRTGEAALTAAEEFLRDTQVNDGWGAEGEDALATSLAVLALAAITDRTDTAVRAGQCRLLDLRDTREGWKASPWIVFPTLDGPVAYSSRVVTTSFALKALSLWEAAR